MLKAYVNVRLGAADSQEHLLQASSQAESARIHQELWALALKNGQRDMNSDVGALYVASINDVIDVHALRIAVIESHIPLGIWLSLYVLVFMGMLVMGYHVAIARSRRSGVTAFLGLAFSLVISLISSLDRAHSGLITVPQKALVDARSSMQ